MKWLDVCRARLMLAGYVTAIVLGGGRSKADFTFGEPTNLGPEINSEEWELSHCVSADGLELYFGSERAGGEGHMDLWVSTRATVEDEWSPAESLGPGVNSPEPYQDMSPCISADGLELYFHSDRPGGVGAGDIWVTRRTARDEPWGEPENIGPPVNTAGWDYNPSLSSDGLELYLAVGPAEELEPTELAVAKRATIDDPWGVPVNLGPVVNNWACQDTPWISSDGLLLMYTDFWLCSPRPGGFGETDIWFTRRAPKDDAWGEPVNLGPLVNTEFAEDAPMISADGSTLYFNSTRPGGSGMYDLWQVSIEPVVDLNGDGIVDAADMCIIVDHWGEDYSLCDIGPMPWGDGIVDVQDLVVLAEHLFEESPPVDPGE